MGEAIVITSGKGGVGKTTLSLHLACYLAREANVLVVDVDHQSSLSLVVLSSRRWEEQVSATNTINRVFETFTNRHIAMPGTHGSTQLMLRIPTIMYSSIARLQLRS